MACLVCIFVCGVSCFFIGIMVGLKGEFAVGGRVQLPPGLLQRSRYMPSINFEELLQKNFIPPEKQLAIIIVLLLIIPLGAKFIIQKITKSKSAGIVAFLLS